MIYYQTREQKIPLTIGGSSAGGDGTQAMGPIIDLTYKSTSKHAQSGKALKQAVDQSIDSLQKRLGSVLRYKGSVASIAALNALPNKEIGDVYDVTGETDPGANYVWTGDAWDKMSENLTHLAKMTQYNTLNSQLTAHKNNSNTDVKHVTQQLLDNLTTTEITSLQQASDLVSKMVTQYTTNGTIYDSTTLDAKLNSLKASIQNTVTNNAKSELNKRFLTGADFTAYKTQFEKDKQPYLQSEDIDALKVYAKDNASHAPDLSVRDNRTLYIVGADVVIDDPPAPAKPKGLELTITTTQANEPVNLGYNLGMWSGYTTGTTVNGVIDWGDGTAPTIFTGSEGTSASTSNRLYHKYATPGSHTITIGGTIKWNRATTTVNSIPADSIVKKCTKIALTSGASSPIKDISTHAFYQFDKLTSIPAGLLNGCINVTNLEYCFASTGITSIPTGLFNNCTKVTDFSSVFSGCKSITSIPTGLFDKCTNAIDMTLAFNGTGITQIPADLFKYTTKIDSFTSCFSNTKITSIPQNLFSYTPTAGFFDDTFNGCNQLTSIPANLFTSCKNILSYSSCFENCSKVRGNLPTFWSSLPSSANFSDCFNGCYSAANYKTAVEKKYASWCPNSLTLILENPGTGEIEIPLETYNSSTYTIRWGDNTNNSTNKHTFDTTQTTYNVIITGEAKWRSSASNSFGGITNPESLADCLTQVIVTGNCPIRVWASNAFSKSFKLKTVTGGLFNNVVWSSDAGAAHRTYDNNIKYWVLNWFFNECSSLTSFPDTIFNSDTSSAVKGTIQSISFSDTFTLCKSLKTISSNLFKNLPSLGSYADSYDGQILLNAFTGSGLTTFPSDLFATLPKARAYYFASAFANCESLTSIPNSPFKSVPTIDGGFYHVSPNQYTGMFSSCTGLKSIPSNILDGVPNTDKTDISAMFQNCTGINTTLPSVWSTHNNTRHHELFYVGCTSAPNYEQVPTGWK